MNEFTELPDQMAWHVLVGAAKRAAEEKGFNLTRMPGRGRSNVWIMEQRGKSRRVSIRTTRDRWFAFPPLQRGTKWKTLNDVDAVMVAAVDDPNDPKKVEVYLFDAPEVRKRFDAAYAARTKAGLTVKDNFGMWVSLKKDQRGLPASVGSGLANDHPPIAVYPIADLTAAAPAAGVPHSEDSGMRQGEQAHAERLGTIADVMNWARQRIASLSGVNTEAVKLDLRIEY